MNNMKLIRNQYFIFGLTLQSLLITVVLACFSGCNNELIEPVESPKRNILFYIATDEGNMIDNDVPTKLNEILIGWQPGHGELIIYADRLSKGAVMMRVNDKKDDSGRYGLDTLEVYGIEDSADKAVLSRSINYLTTNYPADSYGMIFFSHASGWLPEGTLSNPLTTRSLVIDKGSGAKHEMEMTDFAAAIPDGQFDFIVFEACLMSDVVSMYELRDKADYVLASSAEIVAPGFAYVYRKNIMDLFDTNRTVEASLQSFGQAWDTFIKAKFQESDVYCSLTVSLLKMSEMQALATAAALALQGATVKASELKVSIDDIQTFDRPNKLISGSVRKSRYFDLAHTYENITSAAQYESFVNQLNKTVVWKAETKRFMLSGTESNPYYGEYDGFFIRRHCGLTTYIERDEYPYLNQKYEESAWYKATRFYEL
jgi:hypothetical protein